MASPQVVACHSSERAARRRGPDPEAVWQAGDWERVLAELPADLEGSARSHRAWRRRRKIGTAEALLRLALVYAMAEWSIRLVAAWAAVSGLGDLSDVALLYRLRGCRAWLGALVAGLVGAQRLAGLERPVRLRLVDATVVRRAGSGGADWRVHLSLELGPAGPLVDGLELTDHHGAEALTRHPAEPGDIQVADRGHARRTDLGRMQLQGGALVVRIGWQNLPLQVCGGAPLDLLGWARTLSGPAERPVWVATPSGRFGLRLVAAPLPPEAAETARRKLRQAARKKGRTPDQRSLEAAGFVLLVTTLPLVAWPAAEVLALYRLRWQIELAFKRLKSIWHLSNLRARDQELAQTFLLATLLAALLADRAAGHALPTVPWFDDSDRPLSLWRWQLLWHAALRHALLGSFTLPALFKTVPALRRYLCDPPRTRRQQAAAARALLRDRTTDPQPAARCA